ncbi:hypothetical protein W02_41670 [Nitrospira sp. KM1]|nr:hypothetical protein W02_41670 [Nitrospira sp. KM1]
MLSVNIDEVASKSFQDPQGTKASIQIVSMASRPGYHALQNEIGVARLKRTFGPKCVNDRVIVFKMEKRLDRGFVSPRTNLVNGCSSADQETDSVYEEGFPSTCLTGKDGESSLKLQLYVLNEREVDNAQLDEHEKEGITA